MNLARLVAIAAIGLVQGCTLAKTVAHNTADLDDHRIFANRPVAASGEPSRLRTLARTPAFLSGLRVPDERGTLHQLDRHLEETRTAAFVVMRDDRIIYERYFRGYDERSLLNSFSIAKSIVATLAGIAIGDGDLALDATVEAYLPGLAGTAYGPVTVERLLTMTSGVGDAPSYLPGRAQYYYGDDLRDVIARSVTPIAQARDWRYSEGDVQVLAFVLEAATGMTPSAYLAEKLWKPLGMESVALWALDREGGSEKAFCCISARARDFARFGRLHLDAGRWNGSQVVPEPWAARRVLHGVRTADGYLHQHLWWTPPASQGDFYAYGHQGQYVYVDPASRTVIVKFSEGDREDPIDMFRAIAATVRSPENLAQIERSDAEEVVSR
ncbi:MAG: serine hydrolase domain-containing protein [Burkholderiales bacterium]